MSKKKKQHEYFDWDAEPDDGLVSLAERMEADEEWRKMVFPPPEPEPPTKRPSQRARFLDGLAEGLCDDGKLLFTTGGAAYAYHNDLGYFQPVPDLLSFIAESLPDKTTASLLSRELREIADRLRWKKRLQVSPDDFNSNPNLVNLADGVYDLRRGRKVEADPQHKFTYRIEATFAEVWDRACPAFDAFCESSLEGDKSKRQLLLEMIGYCLLDSNDGKCALFLKGQPDSGKSVVTGFVQSLFPPLLTANVPLHQLGDRFFRAELYGKKVNIAGEIAGKSLGDISIFKSITGGDRIVGEFKGRDPFYFTPRCTLLFSGNTLPTTHDTDATAAFLNRIRVLLFNTSIPKDQQDKELRQKLSEERDTIVSLALEAAAELVDRNYEFTEPSDSKMFLKSFGLRGNILQSFIEECCEVFPDARVFNADLYGAFTQFCERNSVGTASRERFYEMLSGVPHVYARRIRIGKENRQGHVGIALKNAPPPGTSERQA